MELPWLISADDHVVEPPHVWKANLPLRYREQGPQLVRRRGRVEWTKRTWVLVEDESGEWADCWRYDATLFPIHRGMAAVSYRLRDPANAPLGAGTYDEYRPGCYDRNARLADMDLNHTEASICFPTFPRFCGQTFLEAKDRDLAAVCVRAYNDWMIDDWCGDDAYGRLIPLTLIPLWDPDMAAAEVRRCAAKGSHSICFTESPQELGLATIYTDFWEPVWKACEETSTVVSIHQGSSSTFFTTSTDAPILVTCSLAHVSAERTLVDWLASGILERYPSIKIALSEGQAGWMPYLLEFMDREYKQLGSASGARISLPPSSYVPGHVYTCIFEDQTSLAMRDRIGMDQIMFETDYPHNDTTWPHTTEVVERLVTTAGLNEVETRRLLRGSMIECYGLERYGFTA